jgi:hypothetical protein
MSFHPSGGVPASAGRDARRVPLEAERMRRDEVAVTTTAGDDGMLHRTGRRGTGPRDAAFVDSLVERLHIDYGVDPDQVRALATEVVAGFAGARVQNFVPILVEKALRQTYRARSSAVALP